MLIILFMRYEYSWRRGTTWHFFPPTLGRILFLKKLSLVPPPHKLHGWSLKQWWIIYYYCCFMCFKKNHICSIYIYLIIINKKERTWDFIVMFPLNAPHIIIRSRRALKSVKTITINLLQEPTDHKSSILNKYQVELFYQKF